MAECSCPYRQWPSAPVPITNGQVLLSLSPMAECSYPYHQWPSAPIPRHAYECLSTFVFFDTHSNICEAIVHFDYSFIFAWWLVMLNNIKSTYDFHWFALWKPVGPLASSATNSPSFPNLSENGNAIVLLSTLLRSSSCHTASRMEGQPLSDPAEPLALKPCVLSQIHTTDLGSVTSPPLLVV